MKTNISENIRKYRKEHKLTQEQLAEAMHVTVGAVSKWESGLSVPDISLIMELADFFGISVDALLGYKIQNNNVSNTAERIKSLTIEKRFDDGIMEVEKALQKYPNSFDIVYRSAVFYQCMGIDCQTNTEQHRALSLFQYALTLVDQNHDTPVGKTTIQKCIAEAYFSLGENEKGLELLKNNNSDGEFDTLIGYVLAGHFKNYSEALPYLSDSLINNVCELLEIAIGLSNVFNYRHEYDSGIEVLLWCKNIYDGLKIPGKNSFFDKSKVILLSGCAQLAAVKNDFGAARTYLVEAKEIAEKFDANPNYTCKNVKFYFKHIPASSSDDFGSTAVAGIENAVLATLQKAENEEEKAKAKTLHEIWEEVKK